MKKLIVIASLFAFVLSSCEKNNCYTCNAFTTLDGKLIRKSAQPKMCRVTKSELETYKMQNGRSWSDTNAAGKVFNYNRVIECSTDKYW